MPMDDTPGTITERQASYIDGLVKKKDLSGNDKYTPTAEQRAWLEAGNYSSMSKAQANKAIGLLLDLNDKPVKQPTFDLSDADTTNEVYYSEGGVTTVPINAADTPYIGAYDNTAPGSDPPTPVQALENKAREISATPLDDEVNAGYYFIVDPTDNVEKFFHVSKGKEGTRGKVARFSRFAQVTQFIRLGILTIVRLCTVRFSKTR